MNALTHVFAFIFAQLFCDSSILLATFPKGRKVFNLKRAFLVWKRFFGWHFGDL